MNRIHLLYLMLVVNLVVMFYTFKKISNKENFSRFGKMPLIYITILFPIIGFILYYLDDKKLFS